MLVSHLHKKPLSNETHHSTYGLFVAGWSEKDAALVAGSEDQPTDYD
jgi:hypothetical protein